MTHQGGPHLRYIVTRTIPEGGERVAVRFWHGFCAGFSGSKSRAKRFNSHELAGTEAKQIQDGRGLNGLVVVPVAS